MIISVIAHPQSKQPRISEREPGIFDVYVSEPAVEGKSNAAIIEAIAGYFGVPKTSVRIKRGHTAKRKIIELDE